MRAVRESFLGSLAQLVEHRAFNPLVLGSNPRRPTIQSNQGFFQAPSSLKKLARISVSHSLSVLNYVVGCHRISLEVGALIVAHLV